MSQADILDFLKKNPNNWFIAKEISEQIKIGQSGTAIGLKKLRHCNFLQYKQVVRKGLHVSYIYKHKP